MKRVAITGSAGYIGSIITARLLELGFEIVGIDDCRTGFLEPMKILEKKFGSKFKFYKNGLNRNILRTIFANENNVDIVIHLAASSKVDESVRNPSLYYKNNVVVSEILLEEMKRAMIKKVIFASSAAVYGEAKYIPIDEQHPLNPTNPYGATKLEVERMIAHSEEWGLRSVIFRFFNVCGANIDGDWGDSRYPSSALVQNVVRGAMKLEPFELTCSKVNTPDETTIRDYVDVTDIAIACERAIEYLNRGGENTVINLGSGIGASIKEVVRIGDKLLGVKTQVKLAKRKREGEVAKVVANNNRAKRILSWRPQIKLEDSVKSLITWYKTHPTGWKY